jgi:hypothetical protein
MSICEIGRRAGRHTECHAHLAPHVARDAVRLLDRGPGREDRGSAPSD